MAKGSVNKEINVKVNIVEGVNERLKILKSIKEFNQLPKAMQKAIASTEGRANMYANKMAKSYANVEAVAMRSQAQQEAFTARTQQRQSVAAEKAQRKQDILQVKRDKLTKLSEEFGASVNDVSRALSKEGYSISETGEVIDKVGEPVEYSRKQFQKQIPALRRFKAEYLSVMFAGMALKRSLDGIVQSQLELWGVTELTSAAWQVVMLPIMEQITPFIYDLLGGFMELPDVIKTGVGSLIGFGWVLGNLISSLGMTGLAWEGFASMFPDEAAKFTEWAKGMGGLSGLLGKAVKIGASFYLAKEAYDDLKSGNILAAMGDALAAGGLWVISKNPTSGAAMIGIGLTLKFIDDEAFALGIMKNVLKVGSWISNFLTEIIKAAFSLGFYTPDFSNSGFESLASTFRKALEQTSIEQGGFSMWGLDKEIMYPTETLKEYTTAEKNLMQQYANGAMPLEEYDEKMQKLKEKYSSSISYIGKYQDAITTLNDRLGTPPETWNVTSVYNVHTNYTSSGEKPKELGEDDEEPENTEGKLMSFSNPFNPLGAFGIPNVFGIIANLFKGKRNVHDGIITPGGLVETDPADYIIATKNPEELAGKNNVTLNVTYNVSVSDKREMQAMMDSNNRKLTEDVRRLINT